jgi:Flp pilus assembly protein TadG
MIRSVRLWLQTFMLDRQGLAAIEFALLAPIMLLLYFGMVEFSTGYLASRRANHSAAIIADLIAQDEVTSKANIDLAFDIGGLVLAPFDDSTLSIRLTSVTLNSKNEAIVDWSRNHGTGLPKLVPKAQYKPLPPDLLVSGQSLIIGESHYVYTSRLSRVIDKPMTFSRRYFLRPRASDKITCSDC